MEERQAAYNDEISLRDLILKVREACLELLRRWPLLALFVLLGAGYKLYRYVRYEPVYPATLTFSVDEDETGGTPGLSGMLGQLGLGSMRPARYNLDKILALSKSRNVISTVLFTKAVIDGREDYLANHIVREYEMKLPPLKGHKEGREFRFAHDSLPAFSREENSMLLGIYGRLIGPPDKPKDALMTADYNEDSNIMSLDVSTTNESLSLELAQQMFTSLSDYYINKAVEKQLRTYQVVSAKRDSVLGELKSAEYALAQFRDSHHGLLMRTDQLTEMRLQREIAGLTAMYTEVVKNTEIAGFSLKNKTPFIRVIDAPISPVTPALIFLPRSLLIGMLIGGFIGAVFILGRRFLREVMRGTR